MHPRSYLRADSSALFRLQEGIMKIAEGVYISEILKPERNILRKRIQKRKRIPGLYCITLPQWGSGILEIYSYEDLLSDFYKSCNIIIVGLAAGREDALVILQRMVDDIAECQMIEHVEEYFCGEKA